MSTSTVTKRIVVEGTDAHQRINCALHRLSPQERPARDGCTLTVTGDQVDVRRLVGRLQTLLIEPCSSCRMNRSFALSCVIEVRDGPGAREAS